MCTMRIRISFALIMDVQVIKLAKVINPVRTGVDDIIGGAATPDLRLNIQNIKVKTELAR